MLKHVACMFFIQQSNTAQRIFNIIKFSAGVTIGDPVLRTGKPLSVELAPGNVGVYVR